MAHRSLAKPADNDDDAAHDDEPKTAGGGQPVGQSDGCGGVEREAGYDKAASANGGATGRRAGGSHHGSHEDGDVEVSTTTASSDGEVPSTNEPVGGGSNFQSGPLSEDHCSDKRGEGHILNPELSVCHPASETNLSETNLKLYSFLFL